MGCADQIVFLQNAEPRLGHPHSRSVSRVVVSRAVIVSAALGITAPEVDVAHEHGEHLHERHEHLARLRVKHWVQLQTEGVALHVDPLENAPGAVGRMQPERWRHAH